MPLAPNWLERLTFLTLNQGPAPALDMWGGPAFQIVLAAIRLTLFETLKGQPLTAAEVSQQLQTDPRATQILLDTLVSLKYLNQKDGRYGLTTMSRKWLTDDGEINFSAYFLFWGAMMEHFMPHLAMSIRSGQPPVNVYQWLEDQPEVSRYFQEGMVAITRWIKDDVIKRLILPANTRRLLDIGGGHAMYSIALCQKRPQLSAVIFDGEQALTVGRAQIKAEGMTERVTTQVGNFLTDDLGTGYDVVLLFNIIHGFTQETNLELFRKIKTALNPGGRLIILEQLPGVAPLPLMDSVVQILSMSFFHLLGGQIYTFEEISGWLHEAGFSDIGRKNILKAGSALISGAVID